MFALVEITMKSRDTLTFTLNANLIYTSWNDYEVSRNFWITMKSRDILTFTLNAKHVYTSWNDDDVSRYLARLCGCMRSSALTSCQEVYKKAEWLK